MKKKNPIRKSIFEAVKYKIEQMEKALKYCSDNK